MNKKTKKRITDALALTKDDLDIISGKIESFEFEKRDYRLEEVSVDDQLRDLEEEFATLRCTFEGLRQCVEEEE